MKLNNILDRYPYWSAHGLGMLVFIPFTYYRGTDPVTTFYSEWLSFFIGLALLACYLFFLKQGRLRIPLITALPLCLAGVIALQISLNTFIVSANAETGMLYLIWAALIMIVAADISSEIGFAKLTDYLAWYFLAGGIWNVFSELNHIENLHLVGENFPELFSLGTIGQRNQICIYLFCASTSLVHLYAKKKLGWQVFSICLLLLTTELGLSSSRSSLLFLFAGGVLLFLWRKMDDQSAYKRLFVACLFFAVLFSAWQILNPLLGYTTGAERLRIISSDASTLQRLFFWRDAWEIFLQAPWLGVGFGEFDWAFFMHGQNHDHAVINNRVEHAHNLFLQVLAEMGLIGFFLLTIITGFWLKRLLQKKRDQNSWWHLMSLCFFGINSMLEYPLWLGHFLGVFAVLLGAGDTQVFELKLSKISHFFLGLAPIIGLFLLFNTGLSYIKLERFYEAVRLNTPSPGNPNQIVPLSNTGLLAPLGLKYFAFVFKLDSEQASEKLAITQKAFHFEPIPPLAYKQVAYLAYVGKKQEAFQLFQLTKSSYPNELKWFISQISSLSPSDHAKLAFLFRDTLNND